MEHEYLENSQMIKESLNDLFSSDEEKVAVVAFVGINGVTYLPKRKNTKVICWPKAGGTNPEGVRRLLSSDIQVKFCDNLHSKVFWCKSNGLIVTSSNLSDNALGEGGLIEFGVKTDDSKYDFQSNVLSKLDVREVTTEELDALDIEHNKFNRKNNIEVKSEEMARSFPEWYKSEYRQKWKIVFYSEVSEIDEDTKEEVFQEHGVKKWKNDNDIEPDTFSEGDMVFQFKTDEEEESIPRANGKWLYVDMVTSTNKIIQLDEVKNVNVPFNIDSEFKQAFKKAFNEQEEWSDIIDSKNISQNALLESIYSHYQEKS